MTNLWFNGSTRSESDSNIIDNLIRKGWEYVPNEPSYDPSLQKTVYDVTNNTYSLVDLTDDEKTAYQTQQQFLLTQQQQITKIDNFTNTIKQGYTVSPENITLALTDSDRNMFTQMLALIKEAQSLGFITDDTEQTIADINGEKHTVTTLRFRQIMVGYGFYYKQLWDNL